jgi:hypothetical protein
VIGKEIQNPDILPENVYNIDETGIMYASHLVVCMLYWASCE